MSSSKSSPGHSKKGFSKADLQGFDLLYQLAHLSAVAAAQVPRGSMFRMASQLPCSTAGYFREIDRLVRGMNYQYSEAARVVAESVKDSEMKSLLLRLSGSLATGEAASDFMNREAQVQAETYANLYERKLQSLKQWTDAYIALMVSVALIIIVSAISTMIYDMGAGIVTGMIAVMLGISCMGAYVIYRTSPREIKTLSGEQGGKTQRLPRMMAFVLVPAALAVGTLLYLARADTGLALIVVGSMIVPIGLVSIHLDTLVSKRDDEMSTFLRVLGSTATAAGTTPTEALGRVDMRSIGSLAPIVKGLHTRLRSRVSPELCWHRFVTDTGSELIGRAVRIFADGISLGGEAEEVGARAALLTMKVNFMRAKRKLVSSTFGWLSLVMHAVILFLLVFLIEIVDGFGKMVEAASLASASVGTGQGAPSLNTMSFNFDNMDFLRSLIVPVIIVLSIVNAVAPKVADGGYSHKFFFYLGVTLLCAGGSMVAAPKLAGMIFGIAGG